MLTEDLRLDELERVESLQHRARALETAQLFALAFHDPKKLDGIQRDLERDMRNEPVPSPEEARAAGSKVEDLMAYAERIERRKRRGISGS